MFVRGFESGKVSFYGLLKCCEKVRKVESCALYIDFSFFPHVVCVDHSISLFCDVQILF